MAHGQLAYREKTPVGAHGDDFPGAGAPGHGGGAGDNRGKIPDRRNARQGLGVGEGKVPGGVAKQRRRAAGGLVAPRKDHDKAIAEA